MRATHLIGGILTSACGKQLDEIDYNISKEKVTCLRCKKTKMYNSKLV